MGRQVRWINLIEATQRSFDAVPQVQAHPELYLIVGHPFVETLMIIILHHFVGLLQARNEKEEGDDAHV